jgi:hypothetical protein
LLCTFPYLHHFYAYNGYGAASGSTARAACRTSSESPNLRKPGKFAMVAAVTPFPILLLEAKNAGKPVMGSAATADTMAG